MILDNGTIYQQVTTGGGYDADRNPIPVQKRWDNGCRCNIDPNHYNSLGNVNGNTFTQASYIILVDLYPGIIADRVRVVADDGLLDREFSVISRESLPVVDSQKIMV